jgi:hypothetical protein
MILNLVDHFGTIIFTIIKTTDKDLPANLSGEKWGNFNSEGSMSNPATSVEDIIGLWTGHSPSSDEK